MVVRDIKASWKKKNRSKSTIENGIVKWKKIKIFYKQRMVFSHINCIFKIKKFLAQV